MDKPDPAVVEHMLNVVSARSARLMADAQVGHYPAPPRAGLDLRYTQGYRDGRAGVVPDCLMSVYEECESQSPLPRNPKMLSANELPAVGTPRDVLDKSSIAATTFHPFKDIWWVVWKSPITLLTVKDGMVRKVKEVKSYKKAFRLMMKKWSAAGTPSRLPRKKKEKK